METTCATRPGDTFNEDFVTAGGHFAVVLDGATPEPGEDNGCVHSVRWLVQRLGSRLTAGLIEHEDAPLPELLRTAIAAAMEAHGGQCDLGNPRSPSATVAVLRAHDGRVDHLVLGDSAVVVQTGDQTVEAVVDERIHGFPERSWAELRHLRNRAGGFWVAGNSPEAAAHALTGSRPAKEIRRACALTDGAYRLVERYDWSWYELLDGLERDGPEAVLTLTRAAESATPAGTFPGKHHDDATVALCLIGGEDGPHPASAAGPG
ncbi:protein phosphatase 2C domain-containing protein [Streptomyces sp. NPDC002018]|uniref:protein phosphatase 2C domain-containing protein n=1 Tax=Streptomyces sp. NPDC002018 TaxID=3364629 RepID=UPI00368648F3